MWFYWWQNCKLVFNHFTPKLLRLIFELVRIPNIFSCTKLEMNLVWDNCNIDVTSFAGIYRFDLFSSQEEADTRIILHTVSLSETCNNLVVPCDDTDVLVLLVYYCSAQMLSPTVYMHSGHSGKYTNKQKFIPVSFICAREVEMFVKSYQ